MRVAACQLPDVPADPKHSARDIEAMGQAGQEADADVVIFPECFLQGYFVGDEVPRLAMTLRSNAFLAVLDRLRVLRPTLVFGLIERDGDHCYNTAVVVARGQLIGRYRKRHLLARERRVFAAGSEQPIFRINDRRVGIAICYDLRFRDAYEGVAERGGDAILAPCNNMLPRVTAEASKQLHNEIRCERSAEHCLWVVSSDVTGVREDCISYGPTAAINAQGAVVKQLPLHTPGLLVHDI